MRAVQALNKIMEAKPMKDFANVAKDLHNNKDLANIANVAKDLHNNKDLANIANVAKDLANIANVAKDLPNNVDVIKKVVDLNTKLDTLLEGNKGLY